MRKLIFVFALCALAASPAWATETEHITRTFTLGSGGTLHLKSFSGRVNITAVDGDQVVVDAVRRANRDRLDHIRLDIRSESGALYIDANKRDSSSWWFSNNNVVDTDFDIKVPRRTNIDVKVFSAAVNVDGVEGRYNVGGFSSRITLSNITGSVKAHTFSGRVEIQAKNWQADQDIDVDTFSGDVTLRVPESAAGLISFNSFSGYLNSEIPLVFRNGKRTNLKAELGATAERGATPGNRGNMRFKTFSGSVRIDR